MKRATWIAACLLVTCSSQAFAARDDYFGKNEPPKIKDNKPGPVAEPRVNVGGDNIGNATVVPGLPYADGGNTCGFVDDYFPSCAFAGLSIAADVVYSYTPTADECVNISLCGSAYDTILQVRTAAGEYACAEDVCGLQSEIEGLALTGGVTYYIVVDGYNTACGTYSLTIDRCPPPCNTDCPPGAIAENEPACFDEYVDATNGGCNSIPPVFTDLPCNDEGVTVCGTYGNYLFQGAQFRDTDWYSINITSPTVLDVCVCGQGPTQLAILDAATGCDLITLVCGSVFGSPGEAACCQVPLNPGQYWIFVGTQGFAGTPCGTPYTMTISGYNCPPVGVEPADWSNVKKMFR